MKIDVFADVGNSRIKIARYTESGFEKPITVGHSSDQWHELASLSGGSKRWAVSGVHPPIIEKFKSWLQQNSFDVLTVDSFQQIPIDANIDRPNTVGLDRLFDAVAASRRYPNRKLLVVDSGTAITLNAVSSRGAFEGGAIMPGLSLMARSLNQFTALLPEVEVLDVGDFPGKNTESNIILGIVSSAVAAVERIHRSYQSDIVVFTGGDGPTLYRHVNVPAKELVPTLTLEGIRIAAEALP